MTFDPIDDAWQALGLEPGADGQEIRQAYARLLRVHRPDTDPTGYQRLRASYDLLLGQASAGRSTTPAPPQATADAPAASGPRGEPPQPAASRGPCPHDRPTGVWLRAPFSHVGPPPPPPEADRGLVVEIIERAVEMDAQAFATWLHAEPRLYELGRKQYVATTIVPALSFQADPLKPKNFEEIFRFLALGQSSPETGQVLQRLWDRNEKRHAADTGHPGGTPAGIPLRHTLDTLLLVRTPGPSRDIRSRALAPGWAERAAQVLDYARETNRGRSPRTWIPERVALIERLADPTRLGIDRLRLTLARIWTVIGLSGFLAPLILIPTFQMIAVPLLGAVLFGYGNPVRRIIVGSVGALVGTVIVLASGWTTPERLALWLLALHAALLAPWLLIALVQRQYFRAAPATRDRVRAVIGPAGALLLVAAGTWAVLAGRHYHIYFAGIAALLVALWQRPRAWLPMAAAAMFTGFLWRYRIADPDASHSIWFAAFAAAALAVIGTDSIARLRGKAAAGHRRVYDAAAVMALAGFSVLFW